MLRWIYGVTSLYIIRNKRHKKFRSDGKKNERLDRKSFDVLREGIVTG